MSEEIIYTDKNQESGYIWFDWAVKHMLRDKANYGILEGFISVIIGKPMKIISILESESNQEAPYQKFNRVDIKARNENQEIVIVEVQTVREMDFLERMIFGAATAIKEQVSLSTEYRNIHKIYTIAIVYFSFGRGKDFLYHGQTRLKGVFQHDEFMLSRKEDGVIIKRKSADIFPEYYLIRVPKFEYQSLASAPIEQWMNYLKTGNIGDGDTALGLPEAREKLRYDKMSKSEQRAYRDHIDDVRNQQEAIDDSRIEGRIEGRTEEKLATVLRLASMGVGVPFIARATDLTEDEVNNMLKQ